MKRLLAVVAALPLVAAAQTGTPTPGAAPPPAQGQGQGRGPNPQRMERMEQRAQLALVVGLAEALDLDTAQALKLRDTLDKLQPRRQAAHKQLADAREAIRDAAQGQKATAAQVDEAIKKAQDARAQIEALQRDTFNAISKDLTPEQKARAYMFLGRFADRFGPGMMRIQRMERRFGPGGGAGMGPGMMGDGMGHRHAMGMGAGSGPGPEFCEGDCPWPDEDD